MAALVVGGGLVGPVISLFLAELGQPVEIYERRADPRGMPSAGGRSINITLCTRGFHALDRLGLGDELRQLAIPARGRVMHLANGDTEVQPYGSHGEAIHSIARRDIHEVVLQRATSHPLITARFEHQALSIDLENTAARFLNRRTGLEHDVSGRCLLACDGVHSRVREQLLRRGRFNFSQRYVSQGYKELRLPPAPGGCHRLEPNAIHIWPRERHMLIGFANRDGSFTLALHLPFEGQTSFQSIHDGPTVEALFERDFPDVLHQMPHLAEDFLSNPVTPMVTVRCAPWSVDDKVLLLGDACHAIVPSYGQGANCSFENCAVLSDLLEAHGQDWGTAFKRFEEQQRPEADTIADLALEHFEELQSLVADPAFLLRKQVERRIEARYPGLFAPLYSMISFTSMPYTEARRRAREQRSLVDELLANEEILTLLLSDGLDRLIDERFAANNSVSATP